MLLAAGCSSRERSNPFDPLNPATSGRPPGFAAIAGDREVSLRWSPVYGGSFTGFQLYRRGPGQTDFSPLTGVLATGVTQFRDIPVVNGQEYTYRLYFVFASGPGNNPSEESAAPGPVMPYVIESGGGDLIRLAPDNRRVVSRRTGFGRTADVAANPVNGDVWVADAGNGRVLVYRAASGVTVTIPGFSNPRAVAADPGDGTAWVCDDVSGAVFHLHRDGQVDPLAIAQLDQPVDAAVDVIDGFVWVCELGGNRVLRYDLSSLQWSASVPAPSRVAVDSVTREGWVTSFSNGVVTRISALGQVTGTYPGYTAPLGVAVDSRRGRIWIADPYAGRVTALRRDGTEDFHVSNLSDAGELSVDPTTGEAWVVLGNTGSTARISPAGVVLRVQGGFRYPYAIAVDPGGR